VAKLRDGDIVRVSADDGTIEALVDPAEWASRLPAEAPPPPLGTARELFAFLRHGVDDAERGASAMLAHAGL
jgi:phosphogluconate dehydratase